MALELYAHGFNEIFQDMYVDYIHEEKGYDPNLAPKNDDVIRDWAKEYLQDRNFDIKSIFNENDETVGFFIIGANRPLNNTMYKCDYTISEVYVKKEYRNVGLASKYVSNYIESMTPGIYMIEVPYDNIIAKIFVRSVFKKVNGYKLITDQTSIEKITAHTVYMYSA